MYSNNSPSISDLILAMLGSARNTKRFKAILWERKLQKCKTSSVRVEYYRLKNKNYIQQVPKGWEITEKGRRRLQDYQLFSYFSSPFHGKSPHNTVLSFDIPVKDKRLRDWLRNQIRIYGYTMLQQSLWIGPGPMPVKFIQRLEKLNIRKNVKIFRIKKLTA